MIDRSTALRRFAKTLLAITILIAGHSVTHAQVRIYNVDSAADNPSMSSNAKDGRITLREAVMAATSRRAFGDAPAGSVSNRIMLGQLSDPLSKEPARIFLNGPIFVHSNQPSFVMISGDFVGKNVVIDGGEKHQLFVVSGQASLTFHWTDLTNGRGVNGGAIHVKDEGELGFSLGEITKCFADNHGGAVYFNSSGVLATANASYIDNQSEGSGGAICMLDGDIDMDRVTVARNEASGYGGGLYLYSDFRSLHVIEDSTIVYNAAYSDGAFRQGGGIAEAYRSTGEIFLDGTLVAENTASIYGWQLPYDVGAELSSISRSNLIGSIWRDIGITNGVLRNQLGSIFSPIDPELSTLDYHGTRDSRNYLPNPNSPAIDAGNLIPPGFSPGFNPTDQRGRPRYVRGAADVGSVERQQFPN